jgi:hypothetical protein
LQEALPDYMIPAAFVALDRLPLLATGKVDREALPVPVLPASATLAVTPVAPRTPTETLVARVWRDLLKVERIGVSDNFFDLGGHSLLIMQAVFKLEAATERRVSPRSFIFNTLEQIARACDAPRPEAPLTVPSRLQRFLSARATSSKP